MLLKNPRSSMKTEDIMLWRYSYGIPSSMEIRVPTTHEKVDWVVPNWVAVYELMLKDGMMFPIPRLIRDVCDHYEIAPSQLMPDAQCLEGIDISLKCLTRCRRQARRSVVLLLFEGARQG